MYIKYSTHTHTSIYTHKLQICVNDLFIKMKTKYSGSWRTTTGNSSKKFVSIVHIIVFLFNANNSLGQSCFHLCLPIFFNLINLATLSNYLYNKNILMWKHRFIFHILYENGATGTYILAFCICVEYIKYMIVSGKLELFIGRIPKNENNQSITYKAHEFVGYIVYIVCGMSKILNLMY